MLVYVIKKTGLISLSLPSRIYGSYWIKDYKDNGDVRELINIREKDGKWVANSNKRVGIVLGGKKVNSIILQDYQYFILQVKDENIEIYVSPSNDNTMKKFNYQKFEQLSVGSEKGNNIVCVNQLLEAVHFKIYQKDNFWFVEDNNTKHGTFVNNNIVNGTLRLFYGDIIFAMGFKLMFFNGFIYMNNPLNTVFYDKNTFVEVPARDTIGNVEFVDVDEVVELYNESDYFVRSPMFTEVVEEKDFIIEAPPNIGEEDKTPLILTMGPMVTMGMTSVVYMMSSINSLQNGGSAMSAAPMIAMSVSMLAGTALWPILTRRYQKKEYKKKTTLREQKYGEYLIAKEKELKSLLESQKQVMLSNFLNSQECYQYIIYLNRYLWARELNQDNFMCVRLGLGEVDPKIKINCPQEKFSLEDDKLEKQMHQIVDNNKKIINAPVVVSLTERNIIAIAGKYKFIKPYMDTMLIQLLALQSYYDLKIVLFTNNDKESGWEYLGLVPHMWNNTRDMRFFSTNNEDGKNVSQYLNQIFESRLNTLKEEIRNEKSYKNFRDYYLIITDDLKEVRDYTIVKNILEHDNVNLGFGLVILHPNLANLPSECKSFITLDNAQEGVILQSELSSETRKQFKIEQVSNIDFMLYPMKLANVPIENEDVNFSFPKVLSFMEMYNAGLVEQLNVLDRWRNSNPIISLSAQVGVDEGGNSFNLDLHEKIHGPHGLIAGMTGSGKSEFIITYILSMALNFHPDEVQFVLIDYKGGGLVGAFENKEAGLKLPHLAGTITNLDVADISRALASIESELKRRQHLFNVARDKLNEGTIDIYKYQKYYRDGVLDEPVSHLFIISDEFAELKDQQPDFMDQLISTARIGRSLGVHLILATQKPSGVVDDQIWSNSRFRVCLKVQDANDSNEMIKRPDAASLKEAGRFYLQVGYDEFFALGQAAWAGSKYIPHEKVYHEIDDKLLFIDHTGNSFKTVEPPKNSNVDLSKNYGEELPNIVKYLASIADMEKISVRKLWLDKIPAIIYVDDLIKKYNYVKYPYHLISIIGEYDDPATQTQGLLTLDFEKNGNTIVYSINDKNMLINSVIYSLAINYSTDELNIYILDMDSEVLKIYQHLPQVGDVIFGNEDEKVKNLFKLIESEINRRKKLFQDYNGSYRFYCENSGKKLPAIIFILTGYENFKDTFEDYEENVSRISRDSVKYGIYLIVTAVNDRAMRMSIRSNFENIIPLKIPGDKIEYDMLLGCKTPDIGPEEGRGVALINDIAYEFQTATVCEPSKFNDYIIKISDLLKEKNFEKANRIPVLPEVVSITDFVGSINNITSIPVGIDVNSLDISTFNFMKNFISLFSSNDFNRLKNFTFLIIDELGCLEDVKTIIVDLDSNYSDVVFNKDTVYISSNDISLLQNSLNDNIQKIVFIVGIESFIKLFGNDSSNKVESYFASINKLSNCHFIFVDKLNSINVYAYNNWFKKYVSNDSGIWIGKGLGDVSFYNLENSYRELNAPITSDYGYNMVDGKAVFIKIVSKGGDIDEG